MGKSRVCSGSRNPSKATLLIVKQKLQIKRWEARLKGSLEKALSAILQSLHKFLALAHASITENNPVTHIVLIWQALQMDAVLCGASPLSYSNEHSLWSITMASFQQSEAKVLISALFCALSPWLNKRQLHLSENLQPHSQDKNQADCAIQVSGKQLKI